MTCLPLPPRRAALLALALVGCVNPDPGRFQRESLAGPARAGPGADPTGDRPGEGAAPPAPADPRPILLRPTEDRRGEKFELGAVAGRRFSMDDVGGWVDDELRPLLARSAPLAAPPAAGAPRPILELRPRLLKAYVDSVLASKTAVFVMEVEYLQADGTVSVARYRGQHAGLNWSSGDGEVQTGLQQALTRCLVQIQADLEARLRALPKGV